MKGLNRTYAGLVSAAREAHEKRKRLGRLGTSLWALAGANDDSLLRSPFQEPENDKPLPRLRHMMDLVCCRAVLGDSLSDVVTLASDLLIEVAASSASQQAQEECLDEELVLAVLRKDESAACRLRASRLQVGAELSLRVSDLSVLELLAATALEFRLPSVEVLRLEAACLIQEGSIDTDTHRQVGAICRWAHLAGVTPRALVDGCFVDLCTELGAVGQPEGPPVVNVGSGHWRYERRGRTLEFSVKVTSRKGEVRLTAWLLGLALSQLLHGIHEILSHDLPLNSVPGARSKQQLIEALADPDTTVRLRVDDRARVLEEASFAFNQHKVATLQEWWHARSQGQVRCKFELVRDTESKRRAPGVP